MSEETPLECLSRLGTSGVLWAQEFNKTAVRLGYSEMDAEWLAGWFANAIENCDVIRCNPLRTENEKLRAAFRVNMLRAFPHMSHDEIDVEIAAAIRESGDE